MHLSQQKLPWICHNITALVGDAGERRRLLWNAFYFCLWKELLLLAVNFMLC
jgi:hypothetical protein